MKGVFEACAALMRSCPKTARAGWTDERLVHWLRFHAVVGQLVVVKAEGGAPRVAGLVVARRCGAGDATENWAVGRKDGDRLMILTMVAQTPGALAGLLNALVEKWPDCPPVWAHRRGKLKEIRGWRRLAARTLARLGTL